jgi:hypothetical protein
MQKKILSNFRKVLQLVTYGYKLLQAFWILYGDL